MNKVFRLFTKRTLWLINILAVILLLCTKSIPYISPSKFWALGLLGLATPFIAGINILFIILWLLFGKWRRMFLSIIAIVLSWDIFSVGVAGNMFEKNMFDADTNKLNVMSYNVRLFDYYNWSGKKNTRKKMLEFIEQKNPNVLCLQEFYSSQDSFGIQNVKAICDSCHYPYVAANKNFITKRGFFGDIIFSKFPIVHQESLQLDTSILTHHFQFADIVWQQDTFRIFNLHLQSVKFDKKDYDLIDDKQTANNNNTQYEQGKIIIKKLKTSFAKRGTQADVISDEIEQSPYTNIVCGDFNDIPSSYTYFTVRNNLNDAFLDKSFGLGRTYNDISPVLRIDNIFYESTDLKIDAFQKFDVNYSDHYPIMVSLEKKEKF